MEGRSLLAAVLVLLLGSVASAQPGERCTHETLTVRATPLTASYCVATAGPAAPGHELPVAVSETYSTPHGSFSQDTILRFMGGEEASRVIRDVPLDRLGLQGTLHVTLVLRSGLVRVEGALLTPGAVTIK